MKGGEVILETGKRKPASTFPFGCVITPTTGSAWYWTSPRKKEPPISFFVRRTDSDGMNTACSMHGWTAWWSIAQPYPAQEADFIGASEDDVFRIQIRSEGVSRRNNEKKCD